MIRLLILTCVAMLAAADDGEVITVPKDVLKVIIGCRQAPSSGGQYAIPVHQTDINEGTGTTSQHISLLSLEELRQSLKKTVHSDAVIGHILSQVEEATKTDDQLAAAGRSECRVENHITIDVPPQEVDDFNDRVQMLMQQNTFLLLEQINTLFSYKLRSQKTETEKYIKRRTNLIIQKLDKIMLKLGIEVDENDNYEEDATTTEFPPSTDGPDDDDDDDDDDDMVTMFPLILPPPISEPEPEPESEPEPEPESEPEPEPEPEPTAGLPPAGPVTEAGMITDAIAPTELFPPPDIGGSSNNSSEEVDDDDEDDGGGFPSPTPTRISGSGSNQGFIRTTQQEPIVFNSGIGFIRPLSRPSHVRPNPRPLNRAAASFQDRMRLAAQRRKQNKRRP